MKAILSWLLLFAVATTQVYSQEAPKPDVKKDPFAVIKKPGSDIKFPALPRKPTPKQEPETVTLPTGVFYVLESQTPFEVGAVEIETVNIISVEAPLTFGGVFVDSKDGKSEIRTYKTGHVAIIQANSTAPAMTTLIVAPAGSKSVDWIYVKIKVGQGPIPPPKPDVTPTPKPDDVTPTPTPVDPNALVVPDGFRVIFIGESSAKISKEEYAIKNSPGIIEFLNKNCVKGTGAAANLAEWRYFDPQQDVSNEPSETIKGIWTKLQPEIAKHPLPQVLICVNGLGYLSSFTATEPLMMQRLQDKFQEGK
jgi:hypothetical protein